MASGRRSQAATTRARSGGRGGSETTPGRLGTTVGTSPCGTSRNSVWSLVVTASWLWPPEPKVTGANPVGILLAALRQLPPQTQTAWGPVLCATGGACRPASHVLPALVAPAPRKATQSVPHERARLRCVGGNCGPRLPRGVAGGTRLSRHASTASPHTCAARCTAGTAGAARLGAGKAAAPLRSTLAAMMGPLARRPSTGCHEGPVPVAILNFGSLKRSEAPLGQHPATVKPSCSR